MTIRFFFGFWLAAVLLMPQTARAGEPPGFLLHFIFTPAYGVAEAAMPTPAVDVCGDAMCSNVVAIIQPKCLAHNNGPGTMVYFQDCAAYAMLTDRGPDINMQLLSHPVTLRFRMGAFFSAPFPYAGGQFTYPLSEYVFMVGLNGTRLVVAPY